MLILEINYKVALDLKAGPDKEIFEVKDIEEIKNMFKHFPAITVEDNKVLKNEVPVGTISTPRSTIKGH